MTENPVYHAFTTKSEQLVKRLINEATILYGDESLKARALWDTGATGTCISTEVANKLSMVPTGKQTISTPSGCKEVNTYLVSVVLPNNVKFQDVVVCDSDIGSQGIDMLIGMDIILVGDFAVSGYGNQTVFSYRAPAKARVDFVQQIQLEKALGQ